MFKKIVVLMGVLALLFGLTACGQDLLASGSSTPTASATTSAPPAPAFTAEQQHAADVCLTDNERKALKPEGDATTASLLKSCVTAGEAVFKTLSPANQADKTTVAYHNDLGTTKSLSTATIAVSYFKGIKDVEVNGLQASDTERTAAQILAMFPNATKDDLNVGSTNIDYSKHTIEKGGNVFLSGADRYLKSQADIAAFLNDANDPAAVAARDHVTKAVVAAGGEKERIRALTGAGYIPIQIKDASQMLGTSFFKDGQVKILDQWRQSLPGDVYWLYFTTDMKLVPEATLRADCGNVNGQVIRIVKPGIPPAASITQPPGSETCPPGTVLQPNGECLPPTPVCAPGTTGTPPNCLETKISGQDPAPRGNAPVGGGKNDTSGPGVFIPEPQMTRPPVVQPAAPATPAPQPAPVGGQPAPSPNPEGPRPTATPEPAAPAPSQAPSTCVPAPGKTIC